MSLMKLGTLDRYDFTQEQLIDLIGDNFRQIEHQLNYGNLDSSNLRETGS